MRTFTKALAVAALSLASVSSFAANWTGTMTGVKIQYLPTFDAAASPALLVTVTGTTCLGGSLRLLDATSAENQSLYDFLLAAKATNGSMTISYDSSNSACRISGWTRN